MIKKSISILLAIALIETAALGSLPQSVFTADSENPLSFSDFGVVTGGKDYGSPGKIIIIQDLHCHPQAQKNISSIIDILDDKFKINNIYLEGAHGDVDIGWLTAIKDKKLSDTIAQSLLENGKLTGAEHYAYKHNAGLKLKGIEDKEIHIANLKRLSLITESQPEITEILSNLSVFLNKTQKQNYGVLNRKLALLYDKHRLGKINSMDYYKKLLRYARNTKDNKSIVKDFNVNIDDYPEIVNFIKSSKNLKKINVKAVQNQLSQVLNELKANVPYGMYSEFINKTNSLNNTDALVKEIVKFKDGGFIDLRKYKELDNFINAQNLASGVNPIKLIDAERKLLKSLQINFSSSEKEMLTVILSELFDHFCGYYQAKLSVDDYKYIKTFGIENYKHYWEQTTGFEDISLLSKYDSLLKEYYEININRDKIFAKHIFNGSKPDGINLIVCGGFHTCGLMEELEEKGISYLVITPKITQDVKIADKIYKEMLLSGFKTDSFALALQIISQGGSQKQLVQILETILSEELKRNSKLNVEQFINDTVNKICEVDETEINKHIAMPYNRPVNNGVRMNGDGSIEIEIYFENTGKKEIVEINSGKNSDAYIPYASIYGMRYAKSAPFWEWLYILPFSIPIMQSKKFKSFLKRTFLPGLEIDDINKGIRYNKNLKISDSIASLLFIASFLLPPAIPFAIILYSVFKSLSFASLHMNKFNNKSDGKYMSVFLSSFISLLPLNLMLIILGPAGLLFAFTVGIPLQILLHEIYNAWLAPAIAASLHRNYVYRDDELIKYFVDFREDIRKSDFNKSVSSRRIMKFYTMLKLFNLNRNKQTINEILPVLFQISKYLSQKKKSGNIALRINASISSQLENMDESIAKYIGSAEKKDDSFWFLFILSQKNEKHVLSKIIENNNLDIRYRLYAYSLLRSSKFDLNESNKKELTDKAGQLIRNFEWKKDLGHIYNDTIFYNEELQAYVTAVYLIMVADHPSFIGRENPAIFKAITEARFDAKYRNADSSLSFGKDYFMQERNQAIFPEIIAHELAHIHLFKLKFLPIKKIAYLLFFLPYNNKLVRKIVLNLQKSMIHELYADVAGYLLASSTGRNPEKFYDSGIAPYLGKNISDFSEEPEEHAGARVQFNQLINMLRHDRREIDYYKFSEIFNRRLRRNIKKSDLYFKEFFFELSESYLTREGYRAVGEPEDLKNNDIITTQELLDSFRASVFGDEYAGIAPFWEWVYMLPGVSFFAESRLFSKILSKTLLKDKSEEEINNTLRTNRIAKTLDIAGSVVLGVCALSGLGIAGLAAFMLTRAIIFSSVHKGYDWKAHWKDKALISVLLFFVPFAVVFASLQFFSLNFIPVIAAGFSLNILLHSVYNKFIAPALSLKKASVFKNLSQEEKQQFVADIIKLKLSSKLNIGVENININAVDNDRYYKKETYAEFFYNGVKLYKDESGKFISDIPKTFLLSLYGLSGSGRETYIETFVKNLIDIYNIEQQESSHKKISDFINGLDGGIADFAVTALLEFAASSAVTVPSFYLVENMSREIYTSSFNLSPVNFDMMYFISKIEEQIKEFDDDIKNLILFQCIEFTGYVLQSQTWLSPALFDGQYGYMQNIVNESYERELSNTKSFDGVFKIMLSNHKEVRMIKTKEAALFEYITIKNNERGSSLIIPDSIVSNFKNIDIASLEDKVYSSYDLEERTASVIRQKSSRGITDRYLIIDCSSTENIAAIAAKIDEYNKSVPEKLKIKEVMLYNADLKDYVLSYKDFTFSTAYVFDFSKFVFDDKNKEKILSLFTNIPAVYSGSDDFVLNYGSRLDNFTKHYLYMLMDIDLIRHGTHHVDMKIAKRIDNAPVQMKTAKEYKDLYDKLIVSLKKYNYFDGAKQIFYKYVTETALRNRGKLDAFIGGNDITASVFNGIIDEYRTLLNFMFYFEWSDRKDMFDFVSEAEKDALSEKFNEFSLKPENSYAIPFEQDSILVASGMSAVKTIAAMFVSENISKIAFGKNVYYENADMFNSIKAFANPVRFYEYNTQETLNLDAEAIFLDLISNSVRKVNFDTEDIPVADIKRIISELSKKEYKTPFYVCIDNSMYPSFQFADILNGIDLPDNFYIIVYGSMQKMHQRGLEIVTSGFLTLISNGHNQNTILNKLKDAVKLTSSDIDTFRYIVLKEFIENNNLDRHSRKLNDNAAAAARALKSISSLFGDAFEVLHPSLYSGEQREIWEKNRSPGIPFIFIRDLSFKKNISGFLETLYPILIRASFNPMTRDSYGFNSLTTVHYGFSTIRINVGINDESRLREMLNIFSEAAYDYFMQTIYKDSPANEMIERIYAYAQDVWRSEKSDELAYNYLLSLKETHAMSEINVLKTFSICNKFGKPVPEIIKSKAADILSKELSQFLNDDERAVYIEALAYSDKPRGETIKELTDLFVNANSSDRAAAANALTTVLARQPVSYRSGSLDLNNAGSSGKMIASMLAAA